MPTGLTIEKLILIDTDWSPKEWNLKTKFGLEVTARTDNTRRKIWNPQS
jgi:hypothetical protein